MSADPVTITASGILDHGRAETVAARLRAAARNGRTEIAVVFADGAVIASANLLAFLLRTAEVLRGRGGRLLMSGDRNALDHLAALGIPSVIASSSASSQGGVP